MQALFTLIISLSLRGRIYRIAYFFKRSCTRRDLDFVLEVALFYKVTHHALRHRRAANVAKTHEHNFYHTLNTRIRKTTVRLAVAR